ncbi:hypothetical protein B0J17DRAFT_450295 [Rhizoctonia solani]|nr:hypothetical protein B0J17DRAFT_450295 [Rhizoctonia solani]
MSFPINVNISSLCWVWHVCAQLITGTACCVFVWSALKSARVILHAVSRTTNLAPSHAKTISRCGKKKSVEQITPIPPFHPNAPVHPQDIPLLELMLRFLDETLNRLAAFGPTVFGMVSTSEILQRLTYINSVQGPLNSRLNRGIAQILTLRDQVIVHRTIIFRYFFPATFLCCLLAGLSALVGVSVESAVLICSGALMLAVAGDSSFAPGSSGAGVFVALFGWTGVP